MILLLVLTVVVFPSFTLCSRPDCTYIPNEFGAVTVPATPSIVARQTFFRCSELRSVLITTGVTELETFAFDECHYLQTATIPGTVVTIGRGAMNGQSLTRLTIETSSSARTFSNNAFPNCYHFGLATSNPVPTSGIVDCLTCHNVESLNIPTVVTTIREFAFLSCTSVKMVTIPTSVSVIEDNAFRSCTSLQTITIPSGVSIGTGAFQDCGCEESLFIAGASLCNCCNCTSSTCDETVTTASPATTASPTITASQDGSVNETTIIITVSVLFAILAAVAFWAGLKFELCNTENFTCCNVECCEMNVDSDDCRCCYAYGRNRQVGPAKAVTP